MARLTDLFDVDRLRLSSGEGRKLDLEVAIEPLGLGGQRYEIPGGRVPVRLDVSRTTGSGHALRIAFEAAPSGPCMRCLEPAALALEIEAREVSVPGGGEELESPYVRDGVLDLRAWVRDALALAMPAQPLCRPDCAGLCPVCGVDLNAAGAEHRHDREPDPRWAKLSELRFDA
ncbi:MAG: YceD family protein [Solirubrobacteraceae bacterium]